MPRTMATAFALTIGAVSFFCSCSAVGKHTYYPSGTSAIVLKPIPAEEKRFGRGVACYVGDRATYGIRSYSVADIGKSNVPRLAPEDLASTRKVLRYVKRRWLRFAYTSTSEFVLYNASSGPCGEYPTLTGACNEGFDPSDWLDGTVSFPGPCVNTPRPWIANDIQKGNVPWKRVFGLQSS